MINHITTTDDDKKRLLLMMRRKRLRCLLEATGSGRKTLVGPRGRGKLFMLRKIVSVLISTTSVLLFLITTHILPSSSSSPPPAALPSSSSSSSSSSSYHNNNNNGFQLYTEPGGGSSNEVNVNSTHTGMSCLTGLLTFELSTGFIYKPSSAETLAMMPSTLQLTDCLDYCLHNNSCLAINFEMGLCVLLSSSAKQNPQNLYSSQFPVFTIYAEKKCLLQGDSQAIKQRHRCQRAWTFERVAGYEMKTRPRRRMKLASKEHCMEACLLEREFECRSANWYRQTNECTLSDQDRHSVSQSEAGDQQIKASLHELYGPTNLTSLSTRPNGPQRPTPPPGLYQNYYLPTGDGRLRTVPVSSGTSNESIPLADPTSGNSLLAPNANKYRRFRQLFSELQRMRGQLVAASAQQTTTNTTQSNNPQQQSMMMRATTGSGHDSNNELNSNSWPPSQYVVVELPANAPVDYLENNCIYEPNKLCEFRKIQNRVLKTVDSIYQDVNSLDECKQKCLNAPYRCYSFDYGDTSERVCRTSHLDQASLLSVKEPYLDVVGAITYELASCFNVSIQCRAREMVAQVSSSKMFRGKIYVKSRPNTCLNDVRESLQFELTMRYHDENCDVRATSTSQQGVFSNDIVIQHHDRIVTTQDVGLSVYCQYDLGNRSITNNVDLAIDRIDEAPIESKTHPSNSNGLGRPSSSSGGQSSASMESGSLSSPLTITSLATTVVKSPNVTMRITNMNGQPVNSATVGDRLALLFEIKEKTSPFGIFVREIIAMDGKQLLAAASAAANNNNNNNNKGSYHYGGNGGGNGSLLNEKAVESMFQENKANSVQFIDSDGCPTDANIMGPLIRMDPAGHRVLAPFDAFKFPTSDMVFFRAVVSSCVSECRPVVCQSANSGPLEALNYIPSTTSTTTTSMVGLEQEQNHFHPLASGIGEQTNGLSRNMPSTAAAGGPAPFPSSYASGQLPELRATTPSPARYWSTTVAASMGTVGQQQQQQQQEQLPARARGPSQSGGSGTTLAAGSSSSSSSSGDSLTTIPGFGVPEQAPVWLQPVRPQPLATTTAAAAAGSSVTTEATVVNEVTSTSSAANNKQQQQQQQQQTGNGQLNSGKASRPTSTSAPSPPLNQASQATNLEANVNNGPTTTSTTTGSSSDNSSNKFQNQQQTINLDTLNSFQRQQIVKLFESKLKQQLAISSQQQLAPSNNNNTTTNNIGNNNNNNISEMADLFLTTIMLNAMSSNANANANGVQNTNTNNNNAQQEDSYTLPKRQHETTNFVSPQTGARTIVAEASSGNVLGSDISGRMADFETFSGSSNSVLTNDSAVTNGASSSNNGYDQDVRAGAQAPVPGVPAPAPAKLINGQQQKSVQQAVKQQQQFILEQETNPTVVSMTTISHDHPSANSNNNNNNNNAAIDIDGTSSAEFSNDLSSSNSNSTAQQSFDNFALEKNRSQQQQSALANSDLAMAESFSLEQQVSNIPMTGNRGKQQQAKSKPLVKAEQEAALLANSDVQRRNRKRQQQQQQQAANSRQRQALADSYLGAYQSYGKRRRRRHVNEEDNSIVMMEQQQQVDWPQSGVYIFVRQPQVGATYLAPSGVSNQNQNQQKPKFNEGFIEIYRALEGPPAKSRRKREAEPSYDMDELVVQSIKIMDRLQFKDEEQQAPKSSSLKSAINANGSKLPRSQLVTKSQMGNQTKSAAFGMDTDSAEATSGLSDSASGWSSSGALSLVIVAASFIFVQIFLVVVCLIEFNQRRAAAAAARNFHQNRARLSSQPHAIGSARCSDHLSRCGSVSTLSTSSSSCATNSLCQSTIRSMPTSNNQLLYNQISSVVDFTGGNQISTDFNKRTFGRREIDSQLLSPTTRNGGGRNQAKAPLFSAFKSSYLPRSWGSPQPTGNH